MQPRKRIFPRGPAARHAGLASIAAACLAISALVTAFALAPLLFEAEQPGTEVLTPVAVVIFSGLISSTRLDTFLTPAMFWCSAALLPSG
jgi:Cu/Ag efflux pump CusA